MVARTSVRGAGLRSHRLFGAAASSVGGLHSTFTSSHRGGSGSPLVCLHGFIDTWRTWELVLPTLERHHDVLAVTLARHAGGPPIEGEISDAVLADAVEDAMDEAGFEIAHLVGNSLGGYVALSSPRAVGRKLSRRLPRRAAGRGVTSRTGTCSASKRRWWSW